MADTPGPGALESPADLIALRRDLHRHPELRFREHRTAALLRERLERLGYDVQTGVGGTGIVAQLASGEPGPHVVLRADMDAMPVADLKDVPWASSVPGVAHVCGHDVHMVVVLGVAERLRREPMHRGLVSFVFQPAEERPFGEPSGAQAMLAEGILNDPPPDAILGLHCWPELPAGSVGVDERIAMAGKDAFRYVLHGKSAHAATPSQGRDAVLGIAQLTTALHQGFSRLRDSSDQAVLNVGTIAGGRSQSVIADRAEITGTVRTIDAGARDRLLLAMDRIAQGSAQMLGLTCESTWADRMPAVINDPRLVRCALEAGREVLGDDAVRLLTQPPMTSDDFALFGELMPALYLKLGVGDGGTWPPLHSGAFDVDERAIGVGISVLHRIALELLEGRSDDRSET